LPIEQAGAQKSGNHRHQHRRDHQQRGGPAERRDIAERDPQAQQRDGPAQQHLQAEYDAGLEARRACDRIERNADQQRNDHRRDGKDLGDPWCAENGKRADRGRQRDPG